LRILPLFGGRLEIGHAVLYQPNIFVSLDRKPRPGEGLALVLRSQPAKSGNLFGRIEIVDGRARFQAQQADTTTIEAINLSLEWPSAYASAALNGSLTLRGMPISLDAWLSQPLEFLSGNPSATILRLRSDALTLSTSGNVSARPHFQYVGRVFATAESLRRLADVLGHPFPRHGSFANLEMRGDLDFESESAALTNLHLSLDGNDYEGDVALGYRDNSLQVSGTLASNLLDITPFLAVPPGSLSDSGQWQHHGLDLSDLRFADLDLRISASRLRFNDVEVGDAALSVITKPGLIDLNLGEATANQGTIKGRLTLAAKGGTLALHVAGNGKDVDLEPMDLGLKRRPLAGSLNASLALAGSGGDLQQIIESLAGHAQVLVTGGQIKGIDVGSTLQQAVPIGQGFKSVDGSTGFDRLSFAVSLGKGFADFTQGQLSMPGLQLDFAGSADLRNRSLDLSVLGTMTSAAGKARSATTPLTLRVTGGWDDFQFVQAEPDLRLPPKPRHNGDLPDDATSYTPPD